jgi:galactonate dehydratase
LAAIDIALWDIKGKRLCVPAYELLAGQTRERVRCYMHVVGDSLDELVADAQAKAAQGFTAVRFSPFAPRFWLHKSYSGWADEAVRRVSAVRDGVGPDVDLCVELHRQMDPAESVALGRRLEPFSPYFYEDPMRPDSPALMADVQAACSILIATGERFTSIYEFQQLLAAKGAAYIRPDLCLCGGLSGCKKAAALAESHHVQVISHNPLSPVSTAACIQLDAAIPNFALQEYTGESEAPKSELLVEPLQLEAGYLKVPEGPGLGIELSEEALKHPVKDKVLDTPIGFDGSVQDF